MREAIVKELVGAVKEIAGSGYSVTAQETTKNNGVKMLGIEIRKPEETVVPRLYEEASKVEVQEHEQSKKHDNRGRISAPERRLQES